MGTDLQVSTRLLYIKYSAFFTLSCYTCCKIITRDVDAIRNDARWMEDSTIIQILNDYLHKNELEDELRRPSVNVNAFATSTSCCDLDL